MRKRTVTSWKNVPVNMGTEYVGLVLGRTQQSVKQLCQSGILPAKKVGGKWNIEKTQLMIYCGVPKEIALQETGLY